MSESDLVQRNKEMDTSDEYDEVMKIAKEFRNETKKKTSPKSKSSQKRIGQITKVIPVPTDQASSSKYTKAELAFKARQEKLREKRILEKAKLTHKQRVEKFNKHLDSLTEHYDIPKVSWTK